MAGGRLLAALCLLAGGAHAAERSTAHALPHPRRLLQQQQQQQQHHAHPPPPPAPLSCDQFAQPSAAVFARAGAVPTIPAKKSPVSATAWTDGDAAWMWSQASGTVPSAWVYFYATIEVPVAQSATLQYSADDAASATLNGVLLDTKAAPLWHWLPQRSRFTTLTLPLQAGRNVLMLGAINYGDGDGVIASVTAGAYGQGGAVLLDTSLAMQPQWGWSMEALPFLCSTAGAPPAPPMSAVRACASSQEAFLVHDYGKGTCLHVKGAVNAADGAWHFPAGSKHNVITQPCASASSDAAAFDNQEWSWSAPFLTHVASGLNLGVAAPTLALMQDGTYAALSAPADGADAPDAQMQAWGWQNYGLMQLLSQPGYSLTDARATAAAIPGLPVHLWQLYDSSSIYNANWVQLCVPRA
jgi:hypothetical protein